MNTNFFIIRFIAIITMVSSLFVSCDDDISDVGADALIGSELTPEQESNLTVTSGQIDVKQPRTNNLEYYLLGDNDHGFGNTKYGVLAQINSSSVAGIADSFSENFDEDNITILSTTDVKYELTDITLVIPFRYSLLDSDDDNNDNDSSTLQYNIESNSIGDALTLNVYESNYVLQTINPNDLNNGIQKYYGDGSNGIEKFGDAIKKDNLPLITSFEYNLSKIEEPFTVNSSLTESDIALLDTENEEGDEHTSEGLSNQFEAIRIPLNDTDFRTRLLNLITDVNDDIDLSLINESDFTSKFRGLYIETVNENGIVEILNSNESLINSGLQLKFTRTSTFEDLDDNDDDDNDVVNIDKNIITTLQFGSPINILTSKLDGAIALPTITEGNEGLNNNDDIILQSGLGRIGTIKLFTDEELSEWRGSNILLNDAILELTVNTNNIGDTSFFKEEDLPDTLFISELGTGSPLADYNSNFSSSDDDNESLKEGHLISIREEGSENIIKQDGEIVYRINITEHLANILNQDSDADAIEENTTLAISVTGDLNITRASDLFSMTEELFINQGSLLCFKTVPLYGSNAAEGKKPRLILTFTDTTN